MDACSILVKHAVGANLPITWTSISTVRQKTASKRTSRTYLSACSVIKECSWCREYAHRQTVRYFLRLDGIVLIVMVDLKIGMLAVVLAIVEPLHLIITPVLNASLYILLRMDPACSAFVRSRGICSVISVLLGIDLTIIVSVREIA